MERIINSALRKIKFSSYQEREEYKQIAYEYYLKKVGRYGDNSGALVQIIYFELVNRMKRANAKRAKTISINSFEDETGENYFDSILPTPNSSNYENVENKIYLQGLIKKAKLTDKEKIAINKYARGLELSENDKKSKANAIKKLRKVAI